jgi:hypothetical protein
MNCLDCATAGHTQRAVAVCHDCGAGVCIDHLRQHERILTRTATMNRLVPVEPSARVIRCHLCAAAVLASHNPGVVAHRR